MIINPGTRLRVTQGRHQGVQVIVWSQAPGPGNYWAHFGKSMVLVHVQHPRGAAKPDVEVKEDA